MKDKKIIGVLTICVIALLAFSCGCGAPKAGSSYIGTWLRQATYTNGQLVGRNPATLVLNKSSFDSTAGGYFVKGDIKASGSTIKMITRSTNCPGHSRGTVTTHAYALSDNGKTLTLVNTQYGAEVKEVYKRGK